MTDYKLAATSQDYKRLHAFLRDNDMETDLPLSWPTIYAEKDDKIRGVISTNPSKKFVAVGRYVGLSPLVMFRLIEFYELLLKKTGVTKYLIPVEDTNTVEQKAIERLFNIKPFTQKDNWLWYERIVGDEH